MVDKRRAFINVVLVLSLLSFVGISVAPILSFVNSRQASTGPTPTPTQTASAKQADLEAQARGYQLVLQREPENQTALRGLLEVRLELIRLGQGDIKDVVEPLEKLSKLNPDNADYTILLAQAKEQTGDREGAAQAYRSILTAKPGNVMALQGLVNLLLAQQRPEAAIGLLQDTLKAAPQANQVQAGSIDVVAVQLVLGQVYASQKRYEEAIAIYDEAIKGDDKDFRPVLGKAIVLKQQGKLDVATALFTKASELAPADYKDQIKQLETIGDAKPTASPSPTGSPDAQGSPTPENKAPQESKEPSVPGTQESPTRSNSN